MSLHRLRFTEVDWRPHPFVVWVCVAGVALLAWSVHAFAQLPSGPGGAGPRAEPWRPATSKWSRAPTSGDQPVCTASMPTYAAVPNVPLAPPSPRVPE